MSNIVFDILNFLAFVSGVVLFVNNLFYVDSNVTLLYNVEQNIQLMSMMIATILAFFVMYISMSSPYETKKESQIYHKFWLMILYVMSLAYVSMSDVVDDPSLIVEATFDFVSNNNLFIDFELNLDGDFHFKEMSAVTNGFLLAFNFAKTFCLFYSIIFLAYIFSLLIVDEDKQFDWKEIKVSWLQTIGQRITFLIIYIVNIVIAFGSIGYDDFQTERDFNTYLDVLLKMADDGATVQSFYTPGFQGSANLLAMVVMVVLAGALLIFFKEEFQFSIFPLFLLTLQSIIRLDTNVVDRPIFGFCVVIGMIQAPIFLAILVRTFWRAYQESQVDVLIVPLANALYRAGNILSLLSLFFLYIGYMYPWLNVEFNPLASLTTSVFDNVKAAEDLITGLSNDVFDVVARFDPCYRKKTAERIDFVDTTGIPSDVNTDLPESEGAYNSELESSLWDIWNEGGPRTNCLETFNGGQNIRFRGSFDSAFNQLCTKFKQDYDQRSQEFRDTQFTQQTDEPQRSYTLADAENEESYFVDQNCRDVQCNVLLGAGIAALSLSAIPFFGVLGTLMKIASKAVHTTFKVGRKIARNLPKLRKVKRRISKIRETVQSLLISTYNSLGATPALGAVFLPVLIGAFVTIVLLVVNRRIYINKNKSKLNQRFQLVSAGIRFALALWFPLVISEGMFLGMFGLYKEMMLAITKALPSSLVESDVDFLPGFEAMRIAYFLGFFGHAIVLLSSITLTGSNVVVIIVTVIYNSVVKIFTPIRSLFDVKRKQKDGGAKYKPLRRYENTRASLFQSEKVREATSFFTKLDSIWLWPMLFSLPVFYLYIISFDESYKYVTFEYKANHDLLEKGADLNELNAAREGSATMGMDTQDEGCGLVGKVVMAVVNEVKSLQLVTADLLNFDKLIGTAFDGAEEFLNQIGDLLLFPSIPLFVPLFSSDFWENLLIFGLPLFNTMLIMTGYVLTLAAEKFEEGSNMFRLFVKKYPSKRRVVDYNENSLKKTFDLAIPLTVFYLALVNIILNEMVVALIQFLDRQSMPFIELSIQVASKYYLSILASLLNILSCVAFYVNIVLPPSYVVEEMEENANRIATLENQNANQKEV